MGGELLLTNTGAAKRACGDLDGALEAFAKARSIRDMNAAKGCSNGVAKQSPDDGGSNFLNTIKIVNDNTQNIDDVLKAYGEARLRRKLKKRERDLRTSSTSS